MLNGKNITTSRQEQFWWDVANEGMPKYGEVSHSTTILTSRRDKTDIILTGRSILRKPHSIAISKLKTHTTNTNHRTANASGASAKAAPRQATSTSTASKSKTGTRRKRTNTSTAAPAPGAARRSRTPPQSKPCNGTTSTARPGPSPGASRSGHPILRRFCGCTRTACLADRSRCWRARRTA